MRGLGNLTLPKHLDRYMAKKKGTVKDVQGLMRHSRTATTTDVYMQEIPESVQSTINSIHMVLRQGPKKIHRKVAKALPTGSGNGAIKSRRGPVHIKVFENLIPIDTKRSQREQLSLANLLICNGLLVDLIGIEPMTSSMPWYESRAK
jgi:hypothetical protein